MDEAQRKASSRINVNLSDIATCSRILRPPGGMELALASGCHTGPPRYIGRRAGMTTRRQSQQE
jgi:hypothetical protein